MTTRFSPFPKLNCQYGSPMGRNSTTLPPDTPLDELGVAGPAGEYDVGGAYWGYGGREGPVWAVWVKGKGKNGVCYVRAKGRQSAKIAALS